MSYQRTIIDKLITNFNQIRFSLFEPLIINYGRLIYGNNYKNKLNKPLVSICVPTFNRGPILIERAIKSALSQSYKNIELIVVGDCCTDDTEKLLSKIKDPRLKFYNMKKRKRYYPQTIENHWFVGGAAPANKAMELATDDWIARLDDDDTWTNDHIEKLLNFAIEGGFEFVSALYEEERFGVRKIVEPKMALDEHYTKKKSIQSVRIGGVSTWLYRSYIKGMKYNLHCWRKDWNKVWDIDLVQRIYQSGAKMGFLDEVVSFVFPRPGEDTIGLDAYKLTEKEKLKKYTFK